MKSVFLFTLLASFLIVTSAQAAGGPGSGGGTQSDDSSFTPIITRDGRFVFFETFATNLLAEGEVSGGSIHIHSVESGTIDALRIPGDYGMLESNTNLNDVSGDGRYVAFLSASEEIFAAAAPAGSAPVSNNLYLFDRETRMVELLNISSDGTPGDGGYPFEFLSDAIDLSGDGRYAVLTVTSTNLADDLPGRVADLFLRDRERGLTALLANNPTDTITLDFVVTARISDDGRFAAFDARPEEGDPVHIYWRDRQQDDLRLVAAGSLTWLDDLSADGRFVIFESDSSDLWPGLTVGTSQIFVYDSQTDDFRLVSVGVDGLPGDASSGGASMSADGRYVVFYSLARNLVDLAVPDVDFMRHIYLADLETGEIRLITHHAAGGYATNTGYSASISGDGRYITFDASDGDLVEGDDNGQRDIFLYDTQTSAITLLSRPEE